MNERLLRLYPPSAEPQAVSGTYLNDDLLAQGSERNPFVYANLLSSLDGRIALQEANAGSFVPSSLTSEADWRLLQELQAPADCLITYGAYLRDLAAGRLGNILQVGLREDASDLAHWRKQQGLADQPAIAVVSASLDFSLPTAIQEHRQPLYLFTVAQAPPQRIAELRSLGVNVIVGQDSVVHMDELVREIAQLGHRRVCLMAGPQLLAQAFRDRAVNRLYLTLSHQFLGGDDFHSPLIGSRLDLTDGHRGRMRLHRLFYREPTDSDVGEWFSSFDIDTSD